MTSNRYKVLTGKTLRYLGWSLWASSFVIGYYMKSFWLFFTIWTLSYYPINYGKRLLVKKLNELPTGDDRPPILFLRSFKDETKGQTTLGQLIYSWKNLGTTTYKMKLADSVELDMNEEQEAFARIMNKIGPYVSLGKPTEWLAKLGSSRLYTSNEDWQEIILKLIKDSKLIIFNAGITQSLQWELEQVVKNNDPLKVLIVLPVKSKEYASFIQWANTVVPVQFPLDQPPARMMMFNKKWEPLTLPKERTLMLSLAPYLQMNNIHITEEAFDAMLENNGFRNF